MNFQLLLNYKAPCAVQMALGGTEVRGRKRRRSSDSHPAFLSAVEYSEDCLENNELCLIRFASIHHQTPVKYGCFSSEKVCCFSQIFLSLILEVNDTFKLRHACREWAMISQPFFYSISQLRRAGFARGFLTSWATFVSPFPIKPESRNPNEWDAV